MLAALGVDDHRGPHRQLIMTTIELTQVMLEIAVFLVIPAVFVAVWITND